ncbi:MAG: acetate--CoA ligase family protein [Thermoproteales archaeon]|nr:acetate--CoA ligase family protein [Thermoproteales archaeon]
MYEIKRIFNEALKQGRKNLTLYESLYVIKKYGLNVADFVLIKDVREIDYVLDKIKFPLVVKVSSSNIVHKSDVGGVILNINSTKELEDSVLKVDKKIKERFPDAYVDGFVLQSMIRDGYEVIIGGLHDEQFGPIIAFGLGGIFVEVLKDVAFDIAPVSFRDALELINQIKGYKILLGYRGKPKANIEDLAKTISTVSRFLWDFRGYIEEMDLNPVIVTSECSTIVDSRIILKNK